MKQGTACWEMVWLGSMADEVGGSESSEELRAWAEHFLSSPYPFSAVKCNAVPVWPEEELRCAGCSVERKYHHVIEMWLSLKASTLIDVRGEALVKALDMTSAPL